MNYNQYTVNGVKINVAQDDISNLKLLQTDKGIIKLSSLRYGKELQKPTAVINCSMADLRGGHGVLGRNQGDVTQETGSWSEQKYLGFAKTADGYKCGELEFWDVGESDCGFVPCLICIKDGQSVKMASTGLDDVKSYDQKIAMATACTFMAIQSDKKTVMLITCEKGINGTTVVDWLKKNWKLNFLCQLDGGGSSEMIVNDNIVQKSTDGLERGMYNGLAFIKNDEPTPTPTGEIKLLYPCKAGGDAQEFKPNSHYGVDFGWIANESDDILAAADGEITYEGYWTDIIGGKEYKPIMCIIKHNFEDTKYDYYTLYTHLASTCINKGDKVIKGQKVGVKGNTGYSFGKHLHFQFMRMPKGQPLTNWNKNAIDPQPYLYRTSEQIYKYQGLVYIPLDDEPKPDPEDDKDKKIKELENKVQSLEKEIEELKTTISSLEDKSVEMSDKLTKIKEIVNKD